MSWRTIALAARDEVARDPILLDYLRRSMGRHSPMSRPEDVLGERSMIALDLLIQAVNGGPAIEYDKEHSHKRPIAFPDRRLDC